MNDFLLQLANESETVREYLNVKDWKNIVKITPESVHRFVGMRQGVPQYQARFIGNRRDLGVSNILMRFANERVFQHLDKKYGYSEETMFQNTWKPQLVKYATGSFNPAVGANSPVDGLVRRSGVTEQWATIRDTADGNVASPTSATTNIASLIATATTNEFSVLQRAIFLFNISSIVGTITGSTFTVTGTGKTDQMSQSASLCESAPASNADVVNGDYDSFGTTKFATDIAISAYNDAGANTWTMNGDGLTFVQTAFAADGIVKLGLRLSGDITNTNPWASNEAAIIAGNFADAGSNEPTLEVTYTPPATGYKNLLLMGVG